ncbi:hypothetical protein F383_04093 [Gossypium arboreum]|uniref:Uncharacterized protein n=1 Tax=Gossypium arboreum TaxID=29729 RepID=A0A0B0PZ59_GOSAR|nr:hypothetical protein F383_04093 [Gossypium arboreum]
MHKSYTQHTSFLFLIYLNLSFYLY